ncbi:MAG TPA: tRNA dihydrouridine synthase DusB [Spirochaetota bacterium]|nr:tRNA dihydrouridine synthase DusB [Spirochaetota bacterium]
MKIGSVELADRLFLAPLAGLTDSPFRRIARQHGASLVFTELISVEGIVRDNRKTMELLKFCDDERPLGMQIFGSNPVRMGEAAKIVTEQGPDLIDINMGCCVQKVCSSGSGAALLRDPIQVNAVAQAVVKNTHLPVTAKIRLGWDDDSRNYRDVVKSLEDAGVSMISVHGRTRAQKYTGTADWEAISEIAALSRLPVAGNGDIADHADALRRLETSGCAAVMIGRGALGNPWIFSGRTPDVEELIAQILAHCDLMSRWYGEYGHVLMRKHLAKYIHGKRNAAAIRGSLVRVNTRQDVIDIMEILREGEMHSGGIDMPSGAS